MYKILFQERVSLSSFLIIINGYLIKACFFIYIIREPDLSTMHMEWVIGILKMFRELLIHFQIRERYSSILFLGNLNFHLKHVKNLIFFYPAYFYQDSISEKMFSFHCIKTHVYISNKNKLSKMRNVSKIIATHVFFTRDLNANREPLLFLMETMGRISRLSFTHRDTRNCSRDIKSVKTYIPLSFSFIRWFFLSRCATINTSIGFPLTGLTRMNKEFLSLIVVYADYLSSDSLRKSIFFNISQVFLHFHRSLIAVVIRNRQYVWNRYKIIIAMAAENCG